MDCIWLSRHSDTFCAGAPQFEITGIPGTFDSRLWIFFLHFFVIIFFYYIQRPYGTLKQNLAKFKYTQVMN